MTAKEQELYNKVKQDPNHNLFSLLFRRNATGEVTSIQGKILKIMSDGVPMIVNSSTIMNNDFIVEDMFPSNNANKSFREISNKIALESPLGEKSTFYRAEREILKGQIPKL